MLEALVAHFRAAREARRNRHGERPLEEFVERLFPNVYDPLGAPPECRPDSGFGPPRGAAAFSAAALCELAALLADETSVGRALVARLDDDETLLHLPPVAGDERWLLLIMRLQAPRRGVFEVDSASLLDGCFVRADPHPARARWRRSVQPFLVRALESLQRWQQASP